MFDLCIINRYVVNSILLITLQINREELHSIVCSLFLKITQITSGGHTKTKTMIKQLFILISVSVVAQMVLAFDCHTQVPDYPDFDIEKVITTEIFFLSKIICSKKHKRRPKVIKVRRGKF